MARNANSPLSLPVSPPIIRNQSVAVAPAAFQNRHLVGLVALAAGQRFVIIRMRVVLQVVGRLGKIASIQVVACGVQTKPVVEAPLLERKRVPARKPTRRLSGLLGDRWLMAVEAPCVLNVISFIALFP